MQDLENKKTALDDDALIYATGADRVDAKTEKENWQSLDAKGKWQYFKDYYMNKLLLTVFFGTIIIAILWAAFRPRPTVLSSVMVLDSILDHDSVEAYFNDMLAEQKLNPKKFTYKYYGNYSSNAGSDVSALSTLLAAGEVKMLAGTPEVIDHYAQNEIFIDLTNGLPEDIKSVLSEDDYYYVTIKETDEQGNPIPNGKETKICAGIRIDNSKFMEKANPHKIEIEYVLCLVQSKDTVNQINTLRAFFGLPMEGIETGK